METQGATMKERGGMPYDVVAFEADELAHALSESEEGIFHRMLRKAWMNGSVPADIIALADLCRVRPSTLRKAWPKLSKLWVACDADSTRLQNKKQESERIFLESKRDLAKAAGKLSAKAREIKRNESTDAEPKLNGRSTPLPSLSQPNKEENKKGNKKGTTREPSGSAKDDAAELFKSAYLANVGNPYGWLSGDFPQLARLRKRLGVDHCGTPLNWESALVNYFSSQLSEFSLQHFAAKFDASMNSPLDRFGKHYNGNGGNGNGQQRQFESKEQSRERRALEGLADILEGGVDKARPDFGIGSIARQDRVVSASTPRLVGKSDPKGV